MRKIHKVTGLLLLFFMVWMAFSGVILNHRHTFANLEVSRNMLPESYAYENWNYGFFKNSLYISSDSILLYGNEGIWLSDEENSHITEWNEGIKDGADNRKVCRIISTSSNEIYCATLFHIYFLDKFARKWIPLSLPGGIDRIMDMEIHKDTIVVLTRSELLIKQPDEKDFSIKYLPDSPDLSPKRSLFRLIWTLHSGELFGTTGKIIVDGMAILIIFLSITGLLMYVLPRIIRWNNKRSRVSPGSVKSLRFSWKWHNKMGYWLIIPLLIVIITGSFLRPPLLLFISRPKIAPPPYTTLRSENKWHDILRAIRFDKEHQEWLLYTSEGFFSLKHLEDQPCILPHQAPVSVMGVNVWEQLDQSWWLVGSFNGLIAWNRIDGVLVDAFTNRPYVSPGGMPFGQHKISGFSFSFKDKQVVFDYDSGAQVLGAGKSFSVMPDIYSSRPMSLWNLALEMHTGRIFTLFGIWNMLYPFILALFSVLMVISGWIVYGKIRRKRIHS